MLLEQNKNRIPPSQSVFLFGCGPLLYACYEEICGFIGHTPDGVLDSSPEKIGTHFREFVCQAPTVLAEHIKPCVILTARKHWGMVASILNINPEADVFFVNYQMAVHKAIGFTNINAYEARIENYQLKKNFQGKRALVTGATKGIGEAITHGLAEMGVDLILVSRNVDALEALKDQLPKNIRVDVIAVDLSHTLGLETLLNHPEVANQTLDLVYNNAAISFPNRDFLTEKVSEEKMLYGYRLNVIAPIAISEHFARLATASRPVRIVNVSSNADTPKNLTYTLTKAALNKFVCDSFESYAKQHAFLYLIDPSDIQTPMNPNGKNPIEAIFPGVWLPLYCKSTPRVSMLHASEFAGMSLEKGVAALIAKYPNQWHVEPFAC